MIDLSIIIINWNTKELLKQCIQSIYDTKPNVGYEILVIDNGSTDGSVEMIETQFPQVNLATNPTNLGFARANNMGIKMSRGRYLCLVNTDVEISNNCVDYLVDHMERNPQTGMVGPRMLNPDKTLQISCYGRPTPWNGFCYALGLDKIFPKSTFLGGMYKKYWPYDKIRSVDVISGCLCVVKRDAIERVGLLDSDFFMYMEDFDWCKRFRNDGWEVAYCPEVEAVHYGGGSSSNESERFWIERTRAITHYWRKHHGRVGKWYAVTVIFVRHILRIARSLIRYTLKPSEKIKEVPKIRESIASLHWILSIRASK